jgi:Tfp pilus assembly protein FimT
LTRGSRGAVAPGRQAFRHAHGFTVLELIMAMGLFVVMAGTTVMVTNAVLPGIRADGQARAIMSLMNYARDLAISNRRDVEIHFDTDQHTATIVRMDGGLGTPIQTVYLEYDVQFMQFNGLGDTPDGYGADGVVDFGDSTKVIFEPDGSVVDETGLPTNGSIYLGIHGSLQAARAITLTGTTARPRMYRWSKAGGDSGWWSPE